MKGSQWYFGVALIIVLALGVIFLLVRSHPDPTPTEASSTITDTAPVQSTSGQGTSSGVINPNAIPE